jgi:hypothetical protein
MLAAASSNDVAPGTLGFLVVFGMAVLLFFLFRSMSRHLRKVNGVPRKGRAAGSPDGQAAGSPEAEGRDADAASARSGATGSGDRRDDS